MAATESKLKQRMVGALVLIALAVIFLPMLFKKEDPVREVVVQAPPMPEAPVAPQFPVEEVAVPEPVEDDVWDQPVITEEPLQAAPVEPIVASKPIAPEPPAAAAKVAPAPAPAPAPAITKKPEQQEVAPGIDKNNLPISWSVQLANLTNKANAEALRDTYRNKQYNAYVRSTGNSHRVLIGPLVKQGEAQAMCKNLKNREGQECFVVRYEP